jgi:hypothetical protein
MSPKRNRTKHTASFEDRLVHKAHLLKQRAKALPLGKERVDLMQKARQAETAADLSKWLSR